MYGDVVLGLKPESAKEEDPFEDVLEKKKHARGVKLDTELTADDLRELVAEFKALIKQRASEPSPTIRWSSSGARSAPCSARGRTSAPSPTASSTSIPAHWGTAVNVQAMVFGNLGRRLRDRRRLHARPGHRRAALLRRVPRQRAGRGRRRRHPHAAADHARGVARVGERERHRRSATRRRVSVARRGDAGLLRAAAQGRRQLERHYQDMQDLEFTIERGKLFMLQTPQRQAHRARGGAHRRRHGGREADRPRRRRPARRCPSSSISCCTRPSIRRRRRRGSRAASAPRPGAAARRGRVFAPTTPRQRRKSGAKVILVRIETSPEDIRGMVAAKASSPRAAAGPRTPPWSRAAWASAASPAATRSASTTPPTRCAVGDHVVRAGRLDHDRRRDRRGVPRARADGRRRPLRRLPNAALRGPTSSARSACAPTPTRRTMRPPRVAFGAEGIGLCRTEHMFFDGERIDAVREMILATDLAGREKALAKLLPMQRGDFVGIFGVMGGRPVTIRLLDPPLHEFLPHDDEEYRALAKRAGLDVEEHQARRRGAPRVQPDARPSRLPPRDLVPGDLRDAGARHHRGGARRRGAKDRRCTPRS